ncbi:MAG: sulfatase-like hydrolase/transferase [Planctomycetota bacterium]
MTSELARIEATDDDQPSYAHTTLPCLAALLPVLIVATRYAREAPWLEDILVTGLVLVGATAIVCGLLHVLIRNANVRPLVGLALVTYLTLSFYLKLAIPRSLQDYYLLIFGAAFILAIVGVFRIRECSSIRTATRFLMWVCLTIGAVQLSLAATMVLPDLWSSYRTSPAHLILTPTSLPAKEIYPSWQADSLPDIYYVVLDAYTRGDVLRDTYSFDNRPFLTNLSDRGFVVASHSRSNYHLTDLSLASSLNLGYLNSESLQGFRTRLPLRSLINDCMLVRVLRQHGYTTTAFATGKSVTEGKSFDQYVSPTLALSDYQDVFFHTTAVPDILDMIGSRSAFFESCHRRRILNTFREIPAIDQNVSSPRFVFAHVMAPHPPFVFDSRGEDVQVHGSYLLDDSVAFRQRCGNDRYIEAYREQLAYVNRLVLELVDRILAQTRRPAVIVIHGDHGARAGVNVASMDHSDLREAFAIFHAIHVPSGMQFPVHEDITPVNTFRLVLNACLGTDFGLLGDRSYFEYPIYSYQLHDVTERSSARSEVMAIPSSSNQGNGRFSSDPSRRVARTGPPTKPFDHNGGAACCQP